MKYIGRPIGMWALFAHSFRKQLTEYYAKVMMTKPMKWFCRRSGNNKFTKKDIDGESGYF